MPISEITSTFRTQTPIKKSTSSNAEFSLPLVEEVKETPQKTSATTPKSIYDIPEAELPAIYADISRTCAALDTSGMTKGEAYNAVEAVFVEKLGKDFLEPRIIVTGWCCRSGNDAIIKSADVFTDMIRSKEIETSWHTSPAVLREAKGYTSMSDAAIRADIRKQYPESMTLKDCVLMGHSLFLLGIEKDLYATNVIENISITYLLNSSFTHEITGSQQSNSFYDGAKALFDSIIDLPCDFERLKTGLQDEKTRYVTPELRREGDFSRYIWTLLGNEDTDAFAAFMTFMDEVIERTGFLSFAREDQSKDETDTMISILDSQQETIRENNALEKEKQQRDIILDKFQVESVQLRVALGLEDQNSTTKYVIH